MAGPETHSFTEEVESESVSEAGREVIMVCRIHVQRELDPEWGLLCGDFVQNLRAALDHLVWQLVIVSGNKPGGDNQFPICSTGTRYWCSRKDGAPSVRDRMLKGVSDDYRAAIDAVQPYRTPGGPQGSPLSVLASLSNADKHRVTHPAFAVALQADADHFDIATTVEGGIADVEQTTGRIDDGAEALRLRYVVPDPDAHVQVNAKIPVQIGFGERGVLMPSLSQIFEFVRDFIYGAAPIFGE